MNNLPRPCRREINMVQADRIGGNSTDARSQRGDRNLLADLAAEKLRSIGDNMKSMIDGPIGDELLKKLSDHPTAALIGLCWMNAGTRNVYNNDGQLVPRRARRTGNVFWGCSNYPKCDFTTNFEPVGAVHDSVEPVRVRPVSCAACVATANSPCAAPT